MIENWTKGRSELRPQEVIFSDNWDLTADNRRFLINTIEDSNFNQSRGLNWQAGLNK